MMVSTSDDLQHAGEPEREWEPSPSELWEELPPDNQRLAVRLLAQLIYKAVMARDEVTTQESPD